MAEGQTGMDFESLLKLMVHKRASDLFITTGVPPSLKVHGKIAPVAKGSLTPDQARQICYAIMTDAQRATFDAHHECNFALSRSGVGRFRVNVFQQRNQMGMVLRRIETTIPTFEDLNLPEVLRELSMTSRGIVLMVGGTGTGKSTTLASMVDWRNQNSTGHIISVEDPIEYVHQHKGCIVTQREVGIDTDSFEDALVNTLRQAPDVILIGEIRHRETMEHAIAFAETGHLCLATLHANNANQAMDRIINFFPEDRRPQLLMDLSLNLKSVVAQRLIPRADGQGRQVAVEVMINTPLMADLILKGEVHGMKELIKKSTEQGMRTFDQALYDLYEQGLISREDALRNADSPNEVRLMIKLGKREEGGAEDLSAGLEGVTIEETDEGDDGGFNLTPR